MELHETVKAGDLLQCKNETFPTTNTVLSQAMLKKCASLTGEGWLCPSRRWAAAWASPCTAMGRSSAGANLESKLCHHSTFRQIFVFACGWPSSDLPVVIMWLYASTGTTVPCQRNLFTSKIRILNLGLEWGKTMLMETMINIRKWGTRKDKRNSWICLMTI